jgi:hypothetical protein
MSEQRTRKQHILPRSYLKRFAQGDKIWVSDFELKKQYQRNIDDAATITDFYTVKTIEKDEDDIIIEQNFLGEIESIAKDAIDHIIKKRTFKDRPQWDYLVNFTAQMYVRTPWFRQIILEIYEHSVNAMAKGILKDESIFNDAMQKIKDKIKPDEILSYEKALEAQKHSNITVDIPRTYYIKLMMEYANKLVPIIGQMTHHLFFVPLGIEANFVTGDVPIIAAPRNSDSTGMWIGDPNCDLYFPLSSKCCLVLNYDSLSTVTEVDKIKIAFINHLMACNCTRIILSENQTFVWMQENRTISDNIQHLIDSWGPEKKINLRAKIPNRTIPPVCRNDWGVLTSDDKDK